MPAIEMKNENDRKIIVTFRNHQMENEGKSKDQGRPIYDDLEVCDIRFPGEQRVWGCFPADEVEPNSTREFKRPITYKVAFKDQYDRFKSSLPQTVAGTALADLPFLTEGKRMELRALNIHTAEQLAALDGANLKTLGLGGRELKVQAQAYIDNAGGSAQVTSMALEIERLRQMVEGLQGQQSQGQQPAGAGTSAGTGGGVKTEKPLEECSDAELKAFIKEKTGEPVRGNISRETLLSRAAELAKEEHEPIGD
jgi:hypothetical protein